MFGNEGIALGRMKQKNNQLEAIIKKLVLKENLSAEEKKIVEGIINPLK